MQSHTKSRPREILHKKEGTATAGTYIILGTHKVRGSFPLLPPNIVLPYTVSTARADASICHGDTSKPSTMPVPPAVPYTTMLAAL